MRMVYVAYVTHHVTHESLERRAEHMTHELESRYKSDAALSEQLAQRTVTPIPTVVLRPTMSHAGCVKRSHGHRRLTSV
jgi:hypothetical protein